jgi:hypothetical protein
MLQTYRAILENNQLQWVDEEPEARQQSRPLTVLVTIVEEAAPPASPTSGGRAAKVLARLAERNALAEITDPVLWQRETRAERPLPGREE